MFIRDSSMVHPVALICFSGKDVSEIHQGNIVIQCFIHITNNSSVSSTSPICFFLIQGYQLHAFFFFKLIDGVVKFTSLSDWSASFLLINGAFAKFQPSNLEELVLLNDP